MRQEKATESQDVLIHVVPGIAASPSPGKPSLDSEIGEIREDMKLEDLDVENLPGQVLTSSNPIPSVRLSAVEPEKLVFFDQSTNLAIPIPNEIALITHPAVRKSPVFSWENSRHFDWAMVNSELLVTTGSWIYLFWPSIYW